MPTNAVQIRNAGASRDGQGDGGTVFSTHMPLLRSAGSTMKGGYTNAWLASLLLFHGKSIVQTHDRASLLSFHGKPLVQTHDRASLQSTHNEQISDNINKLPEKRTTLNFKLETLNSFDCEL